MSNKSTNYVPVQQEYYVVDQSTWNTSSDVPPSSYQPMTVTLPTTAEWEPLVTEEAVMRAMGSLRASLAIAASLRAVRRQAPRLDSAAALREYQLLSAPESEAWAGTVNRLTEAKKFQEEHPELGEVCF